MSEILDFTDYARPFDFKFNEGLYRIPAFSKVQIEKLMQINQRFLSLEKKRKENEQKSNEENSIDDDTGSYFKMQDEFLSSALFKKQDNDTFAPISSEELDSWPVKVKNKVMNEVGKQMSSNISDDEPNKEASEKKS